MPIAYGTCVSNSILRYFVCANIVGVFGIDIHICAWRLAVDRKAVRSQGLSTDRR